MLSEQILIFFQIIFIDLVLAGDNAIIIGMVASQFPTEQRKKIIFWGIGAAIVLRILFTLITAYLLQISGLRLIGGILLLYICYKLYIDVVKQTEKKEDTYAEQITEMRKSAIQKIDYEKANELEDLHRHQEFLYKLLTAKDSFIRTRICFKNKSLNY